MRKLHWVLILPVLVGPVFAQMSWTTNCTVVDYEWSYNSLGQNPCAVAAYLTSSCNNGSYTVPPISPPSVYAGQTSWGENVCLCNTVVYSLVSACAACQGASWVLYSTWTYNCSSWSQPTTYSLAIPNGTRVPHWAYYDVAWNNNWNATAAQLSGDSPESTAGASSTDTSIPASTPGPSSTEATSMLPFGAGASSTEATSRPDSMAGVSPTVVQSLSSTPSLNHHSGKNSGAIAGALVGVLLLIGTIIWYLRRWRSRAERQPVQFPDGGVRIARAFGLPDPNHSMTIGRYYDPSDPATFPKMSETQTMDNLGQR